MECTKCTWDENGVYGGKREITTISEQRLSMFVLHPKAKLCNQKLTQLIQSWLKEVHVRYLTGEIDNGRSVSQMPVEEIEDKLFLAKFGL
jgi:hypothetical protein